MTPGSAPTPDVLARLTAAENRIAALEAHVGGPPPAPADLPVEVAAPPWRHLVRRPQSWRKQLFVKGRNMTAWQLIGTMRTNKLTPAEIADDFDLPAAVVDEAIAYVDEPVARALIELESAKEKHSLLAQGYATEPPPVPR